MQPLGYTKLTDSPTKQAWTHAQERNGEAEPRLATAFPQRIVGHTVLNGYLS